MVKVLGSHTSVLWLRWASEGLLGVQFSWTCLVSNETKRGETARHFGMAGMIRAIVMPLL